MPSGDVYRVVITAVSGLHMYQNVLCVRQDTEPDLTNTEFAAFATDYITAIKATQTTGIVYLNWAATQLWGDGMSIVASQCRREGGRQYGDAITGQAGTTAGDLLPPQSAAVITLGTGQTGKRKRGRIYLFGQVETNQADGQWTTAYLTGLQTAWNTFMNLYKHPSGTNVNFTLGVWSERTASGCVPAPPPQKGHLNIETPRPELAFTPVTTHIIRPVVYTQRRRTRGVGF